MWDSAEDDEDVWGGVIGWEICLMASSSCSPQSQRMLPIVSPVKHSECIRTSGEGIESVVTLGFELEGEEGIWEDADNRPT